MPQVSQKYYIKATIQKVWQAFTDASVIEKWGAGPAKMDAREGGKFSLWDGGVHGTTTKIVPNQLLCQDWYGDDNPDRKYEVKFTFGFDDYRGQVTVRVEHNASDDDVESMSDGWRDYYFEPIKKLLEPEIAESRMGISLKLSKKTRVTDNVWSFRFTPSQPLTWVGGQHIWVELPHDNPDQAGDRRWFTIASAPYEEIVQITTRITGTTFKQALAALPMGGELKLIEKPDGDFVWQDSKLPLVFVAGGIGITAFYSILKQRVHESLPLNVTLIYGNRDDHIPFQKELDTWAMDDPQFTVRYMTGSQLNVGKLTEMEPNITRSLVYISGPEQMVEALGDQLMIHGLPQSSLRLDALSNYDQKNY